MGNLRGPIIYDSLDKNNANENHVKTTPRHKDNSNTSLIVILTGILLFTVLVVYVLTTLQNQAYNEQNQLALVALTLINVSVVIGIVVSILGVSWYLVQYIRRIVKTKGMVSLQDGPFYDVEKLFSEAQFTLLAEKMYAVQEERARQSKYNGVSTLTLDESQTQTTNAAKIPEAPIQPKASQAPEIFGLDILDKINN